MTQMSDLEKVGCRFGHYWVWTSISDSNKTGMCVRDSNLNCSTFSYQIGFCKECNEGYALSGSGKGHTTCQSINGEGFSYFTELCIGILMLALLYILFVYIRKRRMQHISQVVRIERKAEFNEPLVTEALTRVRF